MASLIEELENILEAEEKIYQTLIECEEEKTDVLIRADIPALEKITENEQLAGDDLLTQSNRQVQSLKDIATVLGKKEDKLTVSKLIDILDSRPEEKKKLVIARDNLLKAATRMKELSEQNEILIRQAIELNEYDITLFKSLRQAPETANYDKKACNTGTLLGGSGFDVTS